MVPDTHVPSGRRNLAVAGVAAIAAVGLFILLGSAPRDGVVVVRAEPIGAKVRLDVSASGARPQEATAGPVGARFEHLPRGARARASAAAKGWKPAAVDVVVPAAGGVVEVKLALVPERGLLAVRSDPPGAYLFLDGRQAGRAPAALADVAPGSHVVEGRLAGYEPASVTVEVGEAGVVPVELVLKPLPGTVAPVAEKAVPAGLGRAVLRANVDAMLFIDEQMIGNGKSAWRDLAAGEHKAMARVIGRDQKYKRFTVEDGKTVEIDFTFPEDDSQQHLYDVGNPQKPLYWIVRGGNARGEGRYGDSVEMFKKALELDPKEFEAHRQLGRTYPVFKKWDEAIFHAEQYLALNPDAPDAEFEREMIEIYKQRKAAGDVRMVMPGDPGQGEYPGSRALP